jgi:hypothetical protein
MHLEWITPPLFLSALLAIACCGCLFLFCSLKGELRATQIRYLKERASAEKTITELKAGLEALEKEVAQRREQPPVGLLAPPQPVAGLNLTKRSQAIQLSRRGENPSQIATALGVPLNEVELLLKVHRLVISQL